MGAIADYFNRFWYEEDGVTIVEMVIIIAVILIVLIPTLTQLGTAEDEKLKELQEKISK
ncbi:pilus assembly protein [Brevibacillus sp. M2.1A]|uniref:pilus assembly protein n=1 Tax=Brevibacillus TaxID=55080 RepID=UPI00156B253F|nr:MULTISPECIES: pilus assembly protein [Brevibacillus]MBY0089190.1 pilus assembly protein [Brevibacillus brevis]MCC8433652.1 pilus assembly protein [Brevibacillus sp. M2.1A]MCE0453686.1 pilus assembly protein [Brevibacillus sp. AF8]MCM3146450.1 pilus assembly protein [Brevibacillus sp. MER 51]UKK96111.1 pilus assembly protein [Brevibacillus brevis]